MHDRYLPRPAGHGGYPGPLNTGLSGTGRVADDLYLVAHDDVSGRPLLARGLGLGLAGGLLAELMLGRCIGLYPDGTVGAGRIWPDDGLGRRVRDQVAAERPLLGMRDWLAYLALTAPQDVAARLEQ